MSPQFFGSMRIMDLDSSFSVRRLRQALHDALATKGRVRLWCPAEPDGSATLTVVGVPELFHILFLHVEIVWHIGRIRRWGRMLPQRVIPRRRCTVHPHIITCSMRVRFPRCPPDFQDHIRVPTIFHAKSSKGPCGDHSIFGPDVNFL